MTPWEASVTRWLGKAARLTGRLDWLHPTHARSEGRTIGSTSLALCFARKPTEKMLAKGGKT